MMAPPGQSAGKFPSCSHASWPQPQEGGVTLIYRTDKEPEEGRVRAYFPKPHSVHVTKPASVYLPEGSEDGIYWP